MSDRIKKLKVKKADGTMTDYIPIGTDAEYVEFDNGYKLDSIVGSINPDEDGSIAIQLEKSIKYYDCVADMKADMTLKAGVAKTLGYYEPDDGGGAIYNIIDDEYLIDDSGSIHALDNGLKARLVVENNTVNVKQFGAKGDNATDDTTAFQNAIDYFVDSGIIFVPVGIFLVDSITITHGGITIQGVAKVHHANTVTQMSVIKAINTNNNLFDIYGTGSYSTYLFGMSFRDIYINGDQLAKNGISLNCCSDVFFNNVKIAKFKGFGLKLNNVYDSLFNFVTMGECGLNESTIGGLILDGDTSSTNATRFTNCRLENNEFSLQILSPVAQIIFSNTKFEVGSIGGQSQYCIAFNGGTQIIFDSCIFTATKNQYLITAVGEDDSRSHVTIANSTFTCASQGENGGRFVDLTKT